MIKPNQEETKLAVVRDTVKANNRIQAPRVRGVMAADRTKAREKVAAKKIKDI